MPITLNLPPATIEKATNLAESKNATLSQLFIDFIDAESKRQNEAEAWMSRLDAIVEKTNSHLTGEPYKFNRADAYPEGEY